ncbi:hypothetical protein DSUL_60003 [Desulfovibrionales bacterium]
MTRKLIKKWQGDFLKMSGIDKNGFGFGKGQIFLVCCYIRLIIQPRASYR